MSLVMAGFAVILCVAMVGVALLALFTRSMVTAVLAAGLVGLFAAVLFVVLASPDVAMTEAAIGSGLSTFLFFFVMGRLRREGGK